MVGRVKAVGNVSVNASDFPLETGIQSTGPTLKHQLGMCVQSIVHYQIYLRKWTVPSQSLSQSHINMKSLPPNREQSTVTFVINLELPVEQRTSRGTWCGKQIHGEAYRMMVKDSAPIFRRMTKSCCVVLSLITRSGYTRFCLQAVRCYKLSL
jgi:hypothetical protein